jgi:predicted adenine nucleotide alpha hydrolase (AANH) superfamily ATPase
MLNDIKDSIKAKLYDFAYTPFMSSVLISWVVLNHKYLLVFFTDYDLEKKLALLKEWDFALHTHWFTLPCAMNVFEPILFGLFYVFLYPKISKEFYSYTLERTKELKKIKQDIEDETPLTVKESQGIRKEIDYLTIERDEIRNRLTKTEQYYEQKYFAEISSLKEENESLKKSLENLPVITAERDELKEKFDNIIRLDTSDYSSDEVVFAQSPTVEAPKEMTQQEDDRTKVLRYFYESNYTPQTETPLLSQITTHTGLPRPKIKLIYDQLLSERVLNKNDRGYVSITDGGNKMLVEFFDNSVEG